ncbi:MAG: hypothetical protein HY226_00355 [Candidatus Vogelbacteria bacterium]|nr:hypothetical protein [Candidatus Vogelbacteria bacterium]
MQTWIKKIHTIESQKREMFTGEGAYHGSTKQKPKSQDKPLVEVVSEARPTTLEQYIQTGNKTIQSFDAKFPNRYRLVEQLAVPSQEAVRDDGVTFCWCPFEEALREAGPVTREVLTGMQEYLSGKKRHVYIDSKIQYFEPGDLPVDSKLWHVDGSIAVRDDRVKQLGASILHDMRARFEHESPPVYMAYQSSGHCATQFLDQPLSLRLPELIPSFDQLDAQVSSLHLNAIEHPAGAIVSFDGLSLHRAVHAATFGWRLWIRCTETDVEIHPNESILECYGTVFQCRK